MRNKGKQIVAFLIIVLAIIIFLLIIFQEKILEPVLYNRLKIDLPQNDIVLLEKKIDFSTIIGSESEELIIKFDITEDKLNSFVRQMEDVGYYSQDMDEVASNIKIDMDGWDLNYDAIIMRYNYNFSRYTFMSRKRCHIRVFITNEKENDYKVYIVYNG